MDPTIEWLLDDAEPAVRAQTLVDLCDRDVSDPDVVLAREAIPRRGAAARILEGIDLGASDLYRPKYGAPYHRLIALAEMGVRADEPRAGVLLERCLAHFLGNAPTPADAEVCVVGNLARAALLMGRGEDERVGRAIDWLVATQFPDGGWHCWPEEGRGTLDAWEALGAFAAMPPARRPRECVARGVAFFVESRLGAEDRYEAWGRIHFPNHYYYDVALGLDLVTKLSADAARDERLGPAIDSLEGRRGPDGRWRLDASHPDLAEGAGYDVDVTTMRPLEVEPPGAPSRWATLRALRVLRRVGR